MLGMDDVGEVLVFFDFLGDGGYGCDSFDWIGVGG